MVTRANYFDLEFDHLIDIPKKGCTFAAGRERKTGKIRLFLIYNHTGKCFFRDSLRGEWVEIIGKEYNIFRTIVNQALQDKSIPCLKTNEELEFS